MKDLKLWKYRGKKVRIKCDDGQVFEGKAIDYTSALDNTEEEEESICIGDIMFYAHEIVSIEEIGD